MVISAEGGKEPVWSRDGTKLFYRRINEFWMVEVSVSPELSLGQASMLFEGGYGRTGDTTGSQSYDVAENGERFLLTRRGSSLGLRVVTNALRDFDASR